MGKVIFDISMSLDGYMAAANRTPEEPIGAGGLRLVEWASAEENQEYMATALADLGAVIAGRVTYDTSLPWWGANGPTGSARRPVFVVTHEPPAVSPEDGVYRFVTDGIESALRRARVAAGDKDVTIMGGASVGQQYLGAGLVDEISIHLVPVLLGGGTRMFENLHIGHTALGSPEVIESSTALHLRFPVAKQS